MTRMVSEEIYEAGFAAVRAPSSRTPRQWRAAHERQRQDLPPPGRRGRRAVERARRALSRRRHAGHARRQRGRSVDRNDRALDRSELCRTSRLSSGRVELGAGVTMAAILAERELAFLHPVARAVGGPAVREAATVGGNLFAPPPYGDFAAALLALDAIVMLAGGFGQRELPLEEFLGRRERGTALVVSVAFRAAGDRHVPVCESHARPSQGRVGSVDFRATAARQAAGSAARGSPTAPWARRRCAPKRPNARSKAARSMPPASLRRLRSPTDGTAPTDNAIASAWWRREILPVHLRRLLLGAGHA